MLLGVEYIGYEKHIRIGRIKTMSTYRFPKTVSLADIEANEIVEGSIAAEMRQVMIKYGAKPSDLVHSVTEYREGRIAWPASHIASQSGRLQKAFVHLRNAKVVKPAPITETPVDAPIDQ